MTRSRSVAGLVVAFVSACGGAQADLPPYGEALVFVDTDLPVPRLASRLRVDLYDESGRWFESRDIGRSDPRDWPASFSVFSNDEVREKRVLVRLRAYPEGSTRDYLGERYLARAPYVPPRVAADEAELCASPPELPMGGRVTMRAGARPIVQHVLSQSCVAPAVSGSVMARVTIDRPGVYRFAIADAVPFGAHATLSLRARCADPTSQIACQSSVVNASAAVTAGHFPRFDAKLEPGTYFLASGGMSPDWPADVTVEAMPVDLPLSAPPATTTSGPSLDRGPRLRPSAASSVADPTPASEPVPGATIDRLLLVRLVPGRRDRIDVVLRGACAGTMARLGADPEVPDARTATTCVDATSASTPIVEAAPTVVAPQSSAQGTFATEGVCPPGSSTADRVCVPGGAFLMGSRLQIPDVSNLRKTTPEHIAAVGRFWIDRHEVTVGRFRAAVQRGLAAKSPSVVVNDGPLGTRGNAPPSSLCTWSSTPMGREDLAMSCVIWRVAREYCRSVGGDLPSEAQWEYAASTAARAFTTLYPVGNTTPSCGSAALERLDPGCTLPDGKTVPFGPAPVTAYDGTGGSPGDVTVLGIVNLAGGVAEWVRDSAQTYDGPYWSSAPVIDPVCEEPDAPNHIMKGGSWLSAATPSFVRYPVASGKGGDDVLGLDQPLVGTGFRCVYGGPP